MPDQVMYTYFDISGWSNNLARSRSTVTTQSLKVLLMYSSRVCPKWRYCSLASSP